MDKTEPQAGDVWVDQHGSTMLVLSVTDSRIKYRWNWTTLDCEDTGDNAHSMDGLTLLVRDGKPYPPPASPPVDAVRVECAVMVDRNGIVLIDGMSGQTAEQRASVFDSSDRFIAKQLVFIEKSKLSVHALPAVVVGNKDQA